MTEVLSAPPDDSETRGNTKTKALTAAALGAVGLLGWFAESRGWVNGWPFPFQSLKHPVVGYSGAWLGSRYKRHRATAVIGGGLAANFVAETGQDLVFTPDHSVQWVDFEARQHPLHGDSNLGNGLDALAAETAALALLAQTTDSLDWLKMQFSRINGNRSLQLAPDPPPDPTQPNLIQSTSDEMAA